MDVVIPALLKYKEEKEIDELVDQMCAKGGCNKDGINSMEPKDLYKDVLSPMIRIAELQNKL